MAVDRAADNGTSWLEYHQSGVPILDVRSPGEFAGGHFPGAYNLPLLNDSERQQVGIAYKEHGQRAAILLGLKLVGPRFADIAAEALSVCEGHKAFIYCWRGGLRSQIMQWLLQLVGLNVTKIDRGYKAWRTLANQCFEVPKDLVIISGMTGCGKTELVSKLISLNFNAIDLEYLANHKGSAFGGLGQLPQPTQEQFENLLALSLLQSDTSSPLAVEDESRFIGRLRIPDAFYMQMQASPLVELERPLSWRIAKIQNEYSVFNMDDLILATNQLRKRMGDEQVTSAINLLLAGDKESWIKQLLIYYDRTYEHARIKSQRSTLFSVNSVDEEAEMIGQRIWRK
jgi:tRNA 2-selenouridine synthase